MSRHHFSTGQFRDTRLQRETPECPAKGMRALTVPVIEKGENSSSKFFLGGETGMTQAQPLDDAEEEFDLVNPGAVLGSVMEYESLIVPLIELGPTAIRPVVMNVEVVPDDVDGACRIAPGDLFHEGHQVFPGACVTTVAQH